MSDAVNTDEKDCWSGPSGQSWIAHEAVQDRLLSEALDAVMLRSGLRRGDQVIDIGCGTGALSVAAAKAVGDGGRVLATDISGPMLGRAAERLAAFPQASTLLADAQTADWPENGLETAVSRFGVMFFEDPPRAFANIARALKPDGRMVFAAWAPPSENIYWRELPRVAVAQLGRPPKVAPNTPGPMGLADADWALDQFRSAGLKGFACETVPIVLPVDGTPEDAADLALLIGPAARVVRLFDASAKDMLLIREEMADLLRPHEHDGLVRIPANILVYSAKTA